MSSSQLTIIVATDRRGVIGRGGGLPWRLSSDLKRFKRLTMGHHLLMGRKTFDSIGRALPGRTTVVITRQTDLQLPPGVLQAGSLPEAISLAAGDDQPFVVGGGQIYRLALPLARWLLWTEVQTEADGDVRFPAWSPLDWRIVREESTPASQRDEFATVFREMTRVD